MSLPDCFRSEVYCPAISTALRDISLLKVEDPLIHINSKETWSPFKLQSMHRTFQIYRVCVYSSRNVLHHSHSQRDRGIFYISHRSPETCNESEDRARRNDHPLVFASLREVSGMKEGSLSHVDRGRFILPPVCLPDAYRRIVRAIASSSGRF